MRAGLAVLACACGSSKPHPDAVQPPTASYDVVVVGAGTGGTSAAIAAARRGASVLLVEQSGWVGGQMASVPRIEDIQSGVHTGFVVEVANAFAGHYALLGLTDGVHGPGTVSAEPEEVRDVLVGRLVVAGVTVQLHTSVVSVQQDGSTVTGVTLSDGTIVTSKIVIDATELGDVIPMTTAAYRAGSSTGCVQSITYVAPIRKYAAGVPAELAIADPPPGYDATQFTGWVAIGGTTTDLFARPWSWQFHNFYRVVPDSSGPAYNPNDNSTITRTSVNFANDYPRGPLPATYLDDRADTECAARLFTLQFLYYAQHQLGAEHGELWSVANDEGFDAADGPASCANLPDALQPLVKYLPAYPYVRESRRIVAMHTLTGSELLRPTSGSYGTAFHTAVARGWYGMDLHYCNTPADLDPGDAASFGYPGGVEIPIESLIPIAVDGLLAAEKNIGVTRQANGTTRLEGVTMLTGQAAGTLAAIAVYQGAQPRAVDPFVVQRTLVADGDGLTLDEYSDVLASDPRWGAIQLVGVRGVMGPATGAFSPDTSLTRADAAVSLATLFQLATTPPATSDFSDVPTTDPAFGAIEAIYKAGFTSGCGGGKFCPTNPATRAQLAVFLAKGLGAQLSACTSAPFSDVAATDPACPAIAFTTSMGLVAPCGAGTFCPTASVLRGDAAAPFVATMVVVGAPP
jgi:hypothetical protein